VSGETDVLVARLYAALKHEKSCTCGECSGGLNAVDDLAARLRAAEERAEAHAKAHDEVDLRWRAEAAKRREAEEASAQAIRFCDSAIDNLDENPDAEPSLLAAYIMSARSVLRAAGPGGGQAEGTAR
jgi:hypothetical protein